MRKIYIYSCIYFYFCYNCLVRLERTEEKMQFKNLRIDNNQNVMIFFNNEFKFNGKYNYELVKEFGDNVVSKVSASNDFLILNLA